MVDAFNYSDYFLNAPIGNYDGDVYKHYFDKVVKRNPNYSAKAPYFDAVAAPFSTERTRRLLMLLNSSK